MSHINYNHLYYFWHVYKEGSVVGAAEALFLTPQTITGQIKALEERLHRPHMPPEMVRSRIRELCVELGYTLPPEDDPSYQAEVERLAA